jgi:Cu(I)/Ag(I) efflux system membrane fusion protein
MTMDFMIADPALVKSIAPGSPVRFVFEAGEPGEYIVTGIEPVAGVAPSPAATAAGHGGH